MFLAILIGAALLLIVLAAMRIILGWILPRHVMAKADAAVSISLKFIIQASVVIAAGFILYTGYLVWKS